MQTLIFGANNGAGVIQRIDAWMQVFSLQLALWRWQILAHSFVYILVRLQLKRTNMARPYAVQITSRSG